jgi:hypothetical protein
MMTSLLKLVSVHHVSALALKHWDIPLSLRLLPVMGANCQVNEGAFGRKLGVFDSFLGHRQQAA